MSINNKSNLNPIEEYDPATAETLVDCCALTYSQYDKENDPNTYPPPGYREIARLAVPEIPAMDEEFISGLGDLSKIDLTDLPGLKKLIKPFKLNDVYIGFVLESLNNNPGDFIVAFRGTKTLYEGIADAVIVPVKVPKAWFNYNDNRDVKAHFGFLFLYAFLVEQLKEALNGLNSSSVCLVTGHSLGGALAILATVTIGTVISQDRDANSLIRMYNYGGPKIGVKDFKDVYNDSLPYSYRIVNRADLCPKLPPGEVFEYSHVGLEYSYCWQTHSILGNHDLENNYRPAVKDRLPKYTADVSQGLD